MQVSFLGIGLMGLPMSQRLAEAGYPLTVWNRSLEKCQPLAAAGVRVAPSPASAVSAADLVLFCLTDSDAVCAVWEQIRDVVRPGAVIVDCSSIDPIVTRQLADAAAQRQVHWLDCPVSGGVPGAQAGSLAMMAGGDAEVLERVRIPLSHLTSRITHMGPSGAGQYSKLCNQMIVSCNALVIAEMVAFAEKAGVDSTRLAEAFSGGFADSRPMQILAPEMAERRFTPPKWHVNTLLKDLTMALEQAESTGSDTPMTALAQNLMQRYSEQGLGEQDPATLVKPYLSAQD